MFSTAVAVAVFVAVLEFPVIARTRAGEEPLTVLAEHFGQGPALFDRAIKTAVASGLGVWVFLCLVF